MLLVELSWASVITSLYNTEHKFSFPIPRRKLQKGSSQAPYWGAQQEKRRQQSRIEMREVPTGYTKKMFHCENNLQQAAQIDCGISVLGDFKTRLDKVLSNLVWIQYWACFKRGKKTFNCIADTGKDTQTRKHTKHLLDYQLSHGLVQLII